MSPILYQLDHCTHTLLLLLLTLHGHFIVLQSKKLYGSWINIFSCPCPVVVQFWVCQKFWLCKQSVPRPWSGDRKRACLPRLIVEQDAQSVLSRLTNIGVTNIMGHWGTCLPPPCSLCIYANLAIFSSPVNYIYAEISAISAWFREHASRAQWLKILAAPLLTNGDGATFDVDCPADTFDKVERRWTVKTPIVQNTHESVNDRWVFFVRRCLPRWYTMKRWRHEHSFFFSSFLFFLFFFFLSYFFFSLLSCLSLSWHHWRLTNNQSVNSLRTTYST